MVKLSERLKAVAELVKPCDTLADVGTDHGYIPIYLRDCKKIKYAIAMDINKGPLLHASEHIKQYHMTESIETRLSDGLLALKPGEADVIVIAGMGGSLMMRILSQGRETACMAKSLVLQPQSELMAFREFLYKNGYQITAEDMVFEDGKYYPMMAAKYTGHGWLPDDIMHDSVMVSAYDVHWNHEGFSNQDAIWQNIRIGWKYGALLLERKHPVLHQYLLQQQCRKQKILAQIHDGAGQNAQERILEIAQELEDIDAALALMSSAAANKVNVR